jgi:hypothetical protein
MRILAVLAITIALPAAVGGPSSSLRAGPLAALRAAYAAQTPADSKDWLQLFNGKNLDGWVPKFRGSPLGENYADTFRVVDGVLRVAYDKYGQFEERFGHLFYQRRKFSHYIIAAEYRFVGDQVAGGPNWAVRNNGLMLHSQSPESMGKDQDFPISIEMQLLGGITNGKPRTTANVCTPGTQIFIGGTMVKGHCLNSKSDTYRDDVWVRVEVEVHGGERIIHKVEGKTVLEYEKPTIGGGEVNAFDPAVKVDGTLLTDGYIAIQAESHPTEFRKIEVLNLSGCMDPKSKAYKPYYTHNDPAACR